MSCFVLLLLLTVALSVDGIIGEGVVLRVSKHAKHWSQLSREGSGESSMNANASNVADVPLQFNSVVEAHFAELRFGDSLDSVQLLIDTGSPDTLVVTDTINPEAYAAAPRPRSFADYEKLCYSDGFDAQLTLSPAGRNVSCGRVAALNLTWCQNDRVANFSCGDTACTVFEWYGDGSGRVGAVVNDVVSVAMPPVALYFVRALRLSSGRLSEAVDTALSGILGLSPTMQRGKLPTLLDQLHDAGVIQRRMFGLCLPNYDPFDYDYSELNDGHLVLGAPHNLTSKSLNDTVEFTTPLLMNVTFPDDNGTFVPRYLVEVRDVLIGESSFNFSALALVDSGTVQIVLPPALYDRVADFYLGMCNSSTLSWSMLCKSSDIGVTKLRAMFGFVDDDAGFVQYAIGGLTENDFSGFQSISFNLGNGTLVLDWRHLFVRQKQRFGISLSRGKEDSEAIMLGNHLMRAYRTVFDVDNAQLTWAQPNLCADPQDRTKLATTTDSYPWWKTTTVTTHGDPAPSAWITWDNESRFVHAPFLEPWIILASAIAGAFVLVIVVIIVVTVCRRRREARERTQTHFVRI
jgi:hypothetical protein